LTGCNSWQVHCCCKEPSREAGPRAAASDWALKAAADGVGIPANYKGSPCIKDILEGTAADPYLQHATVKATFEIQVLAKGQLGGVALDRDAG